ncbi:MAG: oligosaccharide flippase family protein [Rhodospirillales bacterium]|nr:oligosaccharide flippase family protein [Alphaproteobacteria bacterium]MCB9986252.1 oligosaccharide flippase family protein [Rhodospirillales bacterium]USO07193.1 MAG: oligosaccharide flippase family protein [Rhodospirillales bacterium]
MSQFIKHSFTMFRGAALGQLIPIVMLPVISRLYGPGAYGVFSGILALASVLAAMGALRLEVAIVLPADETEGLSIARAALRLAFWVMVAMLLIFGVFQPVLVARFGFPDIGYWICAAPVLAFLMTCAQIGGYSATRHRDYGAIAASNVHIQLINGAAAIGLGATGLGAVGLVAARVAGQILGVMRLRAHFRGLLAPVDVRAIVTKYRKFPLFNMPYSLIGTFTREFLILALTAFHQPAAAGLYGMARTAMLAPVSLVSSSLGQVFYREAARSIDDPRFADFAYALMLATACLTAPVLGAFTLWDTETFGFVFGARWAEAGVYASLFAPVAVLFMMTSWPERVFEVRGRQDIPLMLQIAFDGAAVVAVVLGLRTGMAALEAVAVFVVIQCLYHLSYIGFVFWALHLRARRYAFLLLCVLAAGLTPYSIDWLAGRFIHNTLALFMVDIGVTGAACLAGLLYAVRHVGRSAGFIGNPEKAV